MKRKTIEERATQAWRSTNLPKFCTYLLTNGEMTTEAVDIFADELNNWKEIDKPEDNNN